MRARNESEEIKIFITGSSANLMSRELATVWKGEQEIDFVIRSGNAIHTIMQVAYDNLDDEHTRQREFRSLEKAKAEFKNAKMNIIVGKMPKSPDKLMIPLWLFLLES